MEEIVGLIKDKIQVDTTSPQFIGLLITIPTVIALCVIMQGIIKLKHGDQDGKAGVLFGIFMMALVAGAYWIYVK